MKNYYSYFARFYARLFWEMSFGPTLSRLTEATHLPL